MLMLLLLLPLLLPIPARQTGLLCSLQPTAFCDNLATGQERASRLRPADKFPSKIQDNAQHCNDRHVCGSQGRAVNTYRGRIAVLINSLNATFSHASSI